MNLSRSVIIPARRWFNQTGPGESFDRSRGRTPKKLPTWKWNYMIISIYIRSNYNIIYQYVILRYWTCMIRNHLLLPLPDGCWKVNPIASLGPVTACQHGLWCTGERRLGEAKALSILAAARQAGKTHGRLPWRFLGRGKHVGQNSYWNQLGCWFYFGMIRSTLKFYRYIYIKIVIESNLWYWDPWPVMKKKHVKIHPDFTKRPFTFRKYASLQ